MTLRRLLFRATVRFLESLVMAAPSFRKLNLDKVAKVDICTVAFNNASLIKLQWEMLQKNIEGDFCYAVLDNSTDKTISEKIERFCSMEGIVYMKMPWNPLGIIGPSYSHAAALNFLYRKLVCKREPSIFGIIDHDIFPIEKVRPSDYLSSQKVFGLLRERGDAWYLSPILLFFDYQWTRMNGRMDFMPVKVKEEYLDTGGGNYFSYYRFMDLPLLEFPSVETEQFRDGGDYHSDFIAYIDSRRWVHTINGSCWSRGFGEDVQIQKRNYIMKSIMCSEESHV